MTIIAAQASNKIFNESFSTLQDTQPTSKRNIIYSLEALLYLTISAVISGCNTWETIAEYGRLKKDWFRKFYTYKCMPSHDAINDLFCVLDAKKFGKFFINLINGIATKTSSDVVAIDGKTISGAASNGDKFPVHIVTAFCAKNKLCLGQLAADEKSNEITSYSKIIGTFLPLKDLLQV